MTPAASDAYWSVNLTTIRMKNSKTKKTKKTSREEKTVRNESIKRAISSGSSTRDVGLRFGISNKRAWDIANRADVKSPKVTTSRRKAKPSMKKK